MILFLLYVIPILFFIYYRNAGSLKLGQLNPISIILYYYWILVSFIGAIFIFYGFGNNPVLRISSDRIKTLGVFIVLYVMLAFIIGVYFSRYVNGVRNVRKIFTSFLKEPINNISINDSYILFSFDCFSLILVFSAVYVTYVTGYIPQLKLTSTADYAAVLLFRVESSRSFNGIIYIKTILFEQMIPLFCMFYFAFYCKLKTKKVFRKFLFSLILAIYSLTFSLAKSPLVVFVISLFIEYIYIKGGVKLKTFFRLIAFAFVLLILIFFILTKDSLSNVFTYLINRIFIDQISGMYLMFDMFPRQYDYLGISSLSHILSSGLNITYSDPATRMAMETAFPAATARGEMNLLSTLFIGEAWANFGSLGLIFSPIYIGFLFGMAYYYIISHKKNIFTIVFLANISFGLNLTSQFNSYIYNMLFILKWLIILFLYVVAYIFSFAKK